MRKFLLFIALIISGVGFVNAQDVGDNTIIDYDGYSLQFTVTNVEPAECEVICSTQPTEPTAITIPSSVEIKGVECSVTSIGDYAFNQCSRLTNIEIPNSVTSIGNGVFWRCDGLTNIEIPSSVTSIGSYAFEYCSNLTSIEIPNSVTSIGDQAFAWCSNLTSIEIPNSVTSIGNWAFEHCSNLTSIRCHAEDVPTVVNGLHVYEIPSNLNIQVPENSIEKYKATFPWNNYNITKIYPYKNGDYIVVDHEVYSLEYTIINVEPNECEVICETKPTTQTEITIPYSVEINGVEFNVTSIGYQAFYECDGLISIEIPNSVTSIGCSAFQSCLNLTSIKCHAESVPKIDETTFTYCPSDMTIQVPANSLSFYQVAETWNKFNIVAITINGRWLYYDNGIYENACMGTNLQTFWAIMFPTEVIAEYVGKHFTKVAMYDNSAHKGTFSIHIGGDNAPGEMVHIQSYETKGKKRYVEFELEQPIVITGNDNIWIQFSNESVDFIAAFSSDTGEPNGRWFSNDGQLWYDVKRENEGWNGTWMIRAFVDDVGNLEQPDGPVLNVGLGDNTIIDYEGYSLQFTVTNVEPAECEVICSTNTATETAITIPSSVEINGVECSVTTIGNYAFSWRYELISIEIPNSVTSIGDQAFYNCSGLTSIEIPNSVTTIGDRAFSWCSGLTSISVESGNPMYDSRNNCNAIIETSTNTLIFGSQNTIIPNSVTSIGDQAFYNCSGLTSIEIPNSVTTIGNSAFRGCTGLTNIEIPNSVTSIGNEAFDYCYSLLGIKCHAESVPETSTTAFDNCPSEMNIQVPEGSVDLYKSVEPWKNYNVTKMYPYQNGDNVVIDYEGYSLKFTIINVEPAECEVICSTRPTIETAITIPSSVIISGTECSVTTIGNSAFIACTGLTSIEIPNSVTSIGDRAFFNCDGLTSIEIPNSVTSIGDQAFCYCDGLTSIEIPNSVTSIGDWAFFNCDGLTSIEIPNSVTSIGDQAFCYCDGLTSIEIPNSVTSIGDWAFAHCSNLTTIKCHVESVPETNESAFYDCPSDITIQVPANSLSLYQAAEPWNNFNIVAGFNSNINVSSNITEGGFVEGGGNYQDGTEITVSAYVNPNYGFLYWSENDEIVSYSPNYSFIVSEDRKLVANFAINHWIPDYTIYPNFMAVTGVVQIDGIEQRDSNIEIGAFCGDELRGSNRLIYESEYDRYFLYLTIYGKDDDEISFRIYDNSEETELKLYYNETMNFIVDDIVGNVSDPKIFNFTTDYIHRQQLTSNWNWYSTFVDVSGREGFEMMTENLGEQAIQIKSQSVFSNYNAGKWNGGLNTVSTGNMYMIKMSEPIELSMSGVIVEPSEFPIVINPNWKWIPYPVQEEMDIASAFAGFTPNDGDIVKSQDGFTQYYQGIGWNGSLNTMMPGEGYMYQNTSGEEKILYYPTQGKNRNALKANVTTENNYWKPEVTKYPTNMNVIAVVNNSSEDYEIGAFCNGECRGSARPIYIEELDKHIVFMTVYGDEEETIYLKYYDINNDEEYAVSDVFTFNVNAVLGNTMNPYVISLVHANVGEISTYELNIYPNPAKVNDEIYFTKEYEKVEIYNALGVKIAEYENSDYIDGIEDAGVYVVKITDNGMSRYDRIIVK